MACLGDTWQAQEQPLYVPLGAVALAILENYCFQDEPACQISSSGVMSFKRQMQTHRADCSTWTTTVVGKNFKYRMLLEMTIGLCREHVSAVACVKSHARKAHHPMITGGRCLLA